MQGLLGGGGSGGPGVMLAARGIGRSSEGEKCQK